MERFWSHVDKSDTWGCWPWIGDKTASGYGRFEAGGYRHTASRWLLEQIMGRNLKNWEFALHTCDNPPCCNPMHLYAGERWQNLRDAASRGRHPFIKHTLTNEEVKAIRERYAAGEGPFKLSREYGVSTTHIGNLARGDSRKQAGGPTRERLPHSVTRQISSTYCRNGLHEMTPENTIMRSDNGTRSCRACKNAARKRWRERKRAV
jgi:hypothetical protein